MALSKAEQDELDALESKSSPKPQASLSADEESELSQLEAKATGKKAPWYQVSPRGLAKGALEALPTVGMLGGGAVGSAAGPAGMVGGAALGGMAGRSLADAGEKYFLGEDKTRPEFYSGLAGAAASGAGAEAGGQVAGKLIGKATSALGSMGENQTAKAFGARPKYFMDHSGEEVSDMAKFAHDSGIVRPGDNAISISDKANAAKQQNYVDLANHYAGTQDEVNKYILSNDADKSVLDKLTDATPTVEDLRDEAMIAARTALKGKGKSSALNALDRHFDDLKDDFGDGPLNLLELRKIKSGLGDAIDWHAPEIQNKDIAFMKGLSATNDKITNHFDALDGVLDSDKLSQLKDMNKKANMLETISSTADKAAGKARGLNTVPLTGAIVGSHVGEGALYGGANPLMAGAKGMAAAGLVKAAYSYGNPITASVLNSSAGLLSKLPDGGSGLVSTVLNNKLLSDKQKASLIQSHLGGQ